MGCALSLGAYLDRYDKTRLRWVIDRFPLSWQARLTKSLSKLSKAGLVVTKRGKSGASLLARPPGQITLLDIYRASAAPPAFAIHSYPIEKRCPVSCHVKECMSELLSQAQNSFERSLAKITLAHLVGQIRRKAH